MNGPKARRKRNIGCENVKFQPLQKTWKSFFFVGEVILMARMQMGARLQVIIPTESASHALKLVNKRLKLDFTVL